MALRVKNKPPAHDGTSEASVRYVRTPAGGKPSEVVYGFTKRQLADAIGVPLQVLDSSDPQRLLDLVIWVARHQRFTPPSKRPRFSTTLPPAHRAYAMHSIVFSGDSFEFNRDMLEQTAAQLVKAGIQARVVGPHIRLGSDAYCLRDARHLLAIHESGIPVNRAAFLRLKVAELDATPVRTDAESRHARSSPPAADDR